MKHVDDGVVCLRIEGGGWELGCKNSAFNDVHVCLFSCFLFFSPPPGWIFSQHRSECSAVRQHSLLSGIL